VPAEKHQVAAADRSGVEKRYLFGRCSPAGAQAEQNTSAKVLISGITGQTWS
jgi:hypothetical protein